MAFVGLRIAGAVAVLAASGAIAGALIAYGFEDSDKRASAELEHNLDARVEAGRTALAAILEADAESQKRDAQLTEAKKFAAEARARELVLLARTAGDLGEVQLAGNESLELVDTAVDQPGKALELGPPREDGKRIAARVGYARSTPANAALARALGAIVNLGDAPKPFFPPESKVWIFLLCALASALVAFVSARIRLGGPLEMTLDRARALAHGNMAARADENRGSRDARELARAVNALVDRAERLKSQGREARDEDVSQLVRAIEALAKGELGSPIPNVGDALSPLARALDRTSRDLLERVRAIRDLASDMADRASDVGPAAKKIGAAALEQAETLSGIGATAQEAATEVRNSRERLAHAIDAMERGAAAERKIAQELRTAILAAKRRLDTARLPVSGDRGALEEEMKEAAASLDAIAASLPEAPPSVDSAITGNLTAAAAGLVRIAETIARGLRVLERSSHASFDGADQLRRIVGDSTELAARLGSVLAGFAAGTSFEEELLERLERWQEEAKLAAISPDGLTDEGRVLVRQVIESSEGVRARLARMVSATESAIDVLRR